MSFPILIATILRPRGETGIQTHFRTVLEISERRNLDVRLVTPFQLPALIVYPAFAPGPLLRPLSRPWWVWWHRESHCLLLQAQLRRLLKKYPRATVYAQDPVSAGAALKARAAGLPVDVVLAVHFNVSQAEEWARAGFIQPGRRTYRWIRNFEQFVLPRVNRLVFPSEFMQREIAREIPAVRRISSHCVPNFVMDPACDRAAPMGDLISIGTLERRKNHAFLIRVLAAARRRGHDYRLTVVGEGAELPQLRSLARELGVSSLVSFPGYDPDAAALIGRYRAYVHSATIENLPMVMLEALASGRPVFAPAVGGIPEVFSDGVEGRIWDLDDPEGAAELLIATLESPALYAAASAAARERYLSAFSPEVVFDRLLQALLGDSGGSQQPSKANPIR